MIVVWRLFRILDWMFCCLFEWYFLPSSNIPSLYTYSSLWRSYDSTTSNTHNHLRNDDIAGRMQITNTVCCRMNKRNLLPTQYMWLIRGSELRNLTHKATKYALSFTTGVKVWYEVIVDKSIISFLTLGVIGVVRPACVLRLSRPQVIELRSIEKIGIRMLVSSVNCSQYFCVVIDQIVCAFLSKSGRAHRHLFKIRNPFPH